MTRKDGAFTEKDRELIRQRADNRCEVCGARMLTYGQIHHRRPRGMGGTRKREASSLSNALYVHADCHARIESNRKRAAHLGWLVGWGRQIESAEVRLWDGWFYLTPEGTRLPVSAPPSTPDD